METNSTDSTLGVQGTQDFASMVSTAGAAGPSQGGKSAVPGGSTGASGLPTKSLAQIEAEQAGQGGQQADPGQQTSTAQPSQAGNQVQAGQGTGDGQQQQGTQGQAAPVQSQADIIKATADAIVNAQNDAARRQQANRSAEPARPLTADEFNAKYKVARAQPELVSTILGGDPVKAAAALNAYGQDLVQQAVLMTLDLAKADVDKVRGEFQPHIQSWQQYQQQVQAQQAESRFFTAHADLATEKDLVLELKDAFIAKVQAGQIRFENEQQAFQTVANAARNILQRIRGTGTNGNAGTNGGGTGGGTGQTTNGTGQTGGTPPGRQMSAATSAGRTGTGQATVKTDGEHVFGTDWR